MRVCLRERFLWYVSVCVAFSWFLISINILCAAFGGVCQVCLANMERPAIHAGCATSAVFPIPAVQVGEEGFFFGNSPLTKRDDISITKAVELKRVGSWQTAHTGQITSYHY